MAKIKNKVKSLEEERTSVPSVDLISKQVAKFKYVRSRYVEFADLLEYIFKDAVKKHAPLAIIQSRPKDIASFAEKITRKWEGLKTDNPVTEFTDLCGARVIALTKSHSDAICDFIEENFDIDWPNCVNAIERLRPTEFGYLSRHYIISLRPGVFSTTKKGTKIPKTLYPTKGCPMKAEVQVRTILEHAFADVTHDLCYKSSFQVPDKWLRQVAGVAAALETTSNEMEDIVAGIQDYAANYGGTLTPDETENEIKKLETILEFKGDNVEMADRIARLAITIGDWDKVLETLESYIKGDNPTAWRDYGIALIKKYHQGDKSKYKKGQEFLAKAARPEYGDSDAMAAYASSWRRFKTKTAKRLVCEWYQKAYVADPFNAYALSNILELEIIERGDLSVVSLMRPSIEAAVLRCMEQAEVQIS